MSASLPEKLFSAGFTDLVSVIPPSGQLQPSSTIPAQFIGKVPGRRGANGLWGGYGWRTHKASEADVRQWVQDGANFGILGDRFPCVDIDCLDKELAALIQEAAFHCLGRAPVRTGRAPKRLLMYRTEEAFGRMRMWIAKDGVTDYLVEILGSGQQYVIHGVHPTTLRAYEWDDPMGEMKPEDLTLITREKAEEFFVYLTSMLDVWGAVKVEREGDGRVGGAVAADQDELVAPSLDLLRKAVRLIPNNNELFPDRTSYIRMGYAIRAAGRDDLDEAFAIFAEWAGKWVGNTRSNGNDPDAVLADWRRMRGNKKVGWHFIAEQARAFGLDTASLEFEHVDTPANPPDNTLLRLTDQWLADEVSKRKRDVLRFVPERNQWIVWNGSRWKPDATLLAENMIKLELRAISNEVLRRGSTEKEKKNAIANATSILTGGKLATVCQLVKSDSSIAVSVDALDHDPWLLNTPGGCVDLRSGEITVGHPDSLCTKSTTVSPLFGGDCPEWRRFLADSTGNTEGLIPYLRRFCGYALTGDTREQQLTFIFGSGGNGKGTFQNVLVGIFGDYARTAQMTTFTASHGDKHTTELAMMAGARLVAASETTAGKEWDTAKVTSLTGGDRVTAHFMRQDDFTFVPQFKLLFIGNHKPELRDVGDAMKRRIQMVAFDKKPIHVDNVLNKKLEKEWPAILAWMIEGCLEWQKDGLHPPACVQEATEEYFLDVDPIGRWLKDCCEEDANAVVSTQSLYMSWREWTNQQGEHTGSLRRLSAALVARKFIKGLDHRSRRATFTGLRVAPTDVNELLT